MSRLHDVREEALANGWVPRPDDRLQRLHRERHGGSWLYDCPFGVCGRGATYTLTGVCQHAEALWLPLDLMGRAVALETLATPED